MEVLEVKVLGQWGTVCANGFGYEEASVACRMLGYQNQYVNLNALNLETRQHHIFFFVNLV